MILTADVVGGPVSTVPQAVASMRRIGKQLSGRGGLAHFNDLYLDVTVEIRRRLTARSQFFADKVFLGELDVAFANRYLDAVRRWAAEPTTPPKAWAPLFDRNDRNRVTAIQFAAAGVNTHINYDLALALVATWDKLGRPTDRRSQRVDYDRVTDIFGLLYRTFRDRLMSDVAKSLDKGRARTALDLASHTAVDKARDAAFASAELIYALRRLSKQAERTYVSALEANANRIGRMILVEVA